MNEKYIKVVNYQIINDQRKQEATAGDGFNPKLTKNVNY